MKRLIPLLLLASGLGVFHSNAAEAQVTGTFTLTGNIYLRADTTLPTGTQIYCEVTIGVTDIPTAPGTSATTNTETVIAVATLVSGQHYECTPVIHYLWNLSAPTTDSVGISWTLGLGPTTLSGIDATAGFTRFGTHTLAPVVGVPATGSSWGKTWDAYL